MRDSFILLFFLVCLLPINMQTFSWLDPQCLEYYWVLIGGQQTFVERMISNLVPQIGQAFCPLQVFAHTTQKRPACQLPLLLAVCQSSSGQRLSTLTPPTSSQFLTCHSVFQHFPAYPCSLLVYLPHLKTFAEQQKHIFTLGAPVPSTAPGQRSFLVKVCRMLFSLWSLCARSKGSEMAFACRVRNL